MRDASNEAKIQIEQAKMELEAKISQLNRSNESLQSEIKQMTKEKSSVLGQMQQETTLMHQEKARF